MADICDISQEKATGNSISRCPALAAVRKTRNHTIYGFGLFAKQACAARTVIAISRGLTFYADAPLKTDLQPWEKTWGDHAVVVPRRFYGLTGLSTSPRVDIVAVPSGNYRSVMTLGGYLPFFANHASALRRQNAKLSFTSEDEVRVVVTLLRTVKRNEEIYVDYGGSHGKNLKASAVAARARARVMRHIARVKRWTCGRCGNLYPHKDHFKHIGVCTAKK